MHVPSTVDQRLRSEAIIWMTTVNAGGRPQPSPIWFLWDGSRILMFSKDRTARLRNLSRNPEVALNLDGDGRGGDIVIIEGSARVDRSHPPATDVPEYLAKYRGFIERYGWTPGSFSTDYPVPVLITPERLRAW